MPVAHSEMSQSEGGRSEATRVLDGVRDMLGVLGWQGWEITVTATVTVATIVEF